MAANSTQNLIRSQSKGWLLSYREDGRGRQWQGARAPPKDRIAGKLYNTPEGKWVRYCEQNKRRPVISLCLHLQPHPNNFLPL